MRFRGFACLLGLLAVHVVVACSGSSAPRSAGSAERPSDLTGRELRDYDAQLARLPSPCTKKTTLAECLDDPGDCAVCPAAARFVADSIRRGGVPQEVEARYMVRFDPALEKTIDVDGAPVLGPANAAVTIVKFADFQCPYCAATVPMLDALVEEFAPHVRVVFMHYPLQHHPSARLAAQAGVAANHQGKFWELHHLMFTNADRLEKVDIDRYARSLNLDMRKFREDWDAWATKVRVQANYNQGSDLGIRGVPAFFINGRPFDTGLFELGGEDLHAWIVLEIEMATGKPFENAR